MKYRIAIDANEANTLQRVGSNVYAFSILRQLYRLTNNHHYQIEVLLAKEPVKDLPPERTNWRYRVIGPSKLWTMWALPLYLKKKQQQFDVFYTPGHYGPSTSPIPIVSSVMDLAFLEYPQFFRFKDLMQLEIWTKSTVLRAEKVITISKHSLKMIHRYYGKSARQIEVAPPALDFKPLKRKSSNDRKKIKKLGIKEPFIVYLGTIQPRKNLQRLVKAYEKLRKTWPTGKKATRPPQLVIAGKIGWLSDGIIKKIAQSKYQTDIIMTGFVTETEKRALLSWACCSVQIGLHEGFGIPALESLAYGTVPVVANSSSLPEVVGKAGLLVDPFDTGQIAQMLTKACQLKPRERTKLKNLGHQQVAKFSWTKSARIVLDSLKEVAAGRANNH